MFCEEIKKVSVTNRFWISYGGCTLFTSIPPTETIDFAVILLFENNPGLDITKAELRNCVFSAYFQVHIFFYKVRFTTK